MVARNPTDFTRYINTGRVNSRLAITKTALDELIDEQQFAVDCEQLIISAPTLRIGAGFLGYRAGEIFPNVLGKQDGSGSYTAYPVAYVAAGAPGASTWEIWTRTGHAAAWAVNSVNITGVTGWMYFGANIVCPVGGDIYVGVTSAGSHLLESFGLYAIET
jgi:hypothetical protein